LQGFANLILALTARIANQLTQASKLAAIEHAASDAAKASVFTPTVDVNSNGR
jgi:hypothetical protein